jgi:hypothetical protein
MQLKQVKPDQLESLAKDDEENDLERFVKLQKLLPNVDGTGKRVLKIQFKNEEISHILDGKKKVIFGSAENCTIKLTKGERIFRHHFEIVFKNGKLAMTLKGRDPI